MKRFLLIVAFPWAVHAQPLETVIQQGHELAVTAIAFSPDSQLVATGSKDKTAKVWELKSGREVRSLLGHTATVSVVRFSPSGKHLVTASRDQTTRLWDVATGKELFSFASPTESFMTSVAVDPQDRFLATGGYSPRYGDTVYVYDLKTRRIAQRIPVSPDKGLGYGVDVTFSSDGQWLGIGEDNRVARLFSTSTWQVVHTLTFEEGWCGGCGTRVVFSPDSKSVYMASHNGPVKKYDLASGKVLLQYEKECDDLTGLALSSDGKKIARATETQVVVWEEATGKQVVQWAAEEKGEFHELAFAPDNTSVWITSDDNTAFALSLETKKKTATLTGLLNERDRGGLNYDPNFVWQSAMARYVRFKNQVMLTRDGKQLIKGKFGTRVKRWDIASGQGVMEYIGHQKAVLSYDLSKDGRFMLTGGGDGKVILWDVEKGDSLRVFRPHREPIFDIRFSTDETQFACASWDATLRVYDLNLGQSIQYWDFENTSVYNLAWHPSDLYLFIAKLDYSLLMTELDTRASVRSFVGHTDVISSVRVSPDGQQLLSASWDGSIRLWSIATGLMSKKFKGHQGAVHTAIFSADGKQVFSAGADRQIRLWDAATGKMLKAFTGHTAEVTSLVLSPDGRMLISHSVDGATKFWDLSAGKEFFEHIHLGPHDWMVKTPEGYFNGTGKAREYIHFVSGLRTYGIDQFFDEFYRPELLPQLFKSRGSSDLQNILGKLKTAPPPQVRIATLPTSNPAEVEVYIKLTDQGDGADNLRLFHNEKSVLINRAALRYPSGKGQITTYQQVVSLVGGNNTFKAVASNKSRVDSAPVEVEVFADVPGKSSTCYILAVGINQYKNPRLNLNYAKPDAESFIAVVDDHAKSLFGNIELHTLYDEEASKKNILKSLDDITSKVNPEDVFIFYYAGHGSMVDNRFFFIPTESLRLYDLSSLQHEALEASVLQEKFKSIKALKQLIVMDACQSGGSVELLANRGASEEKAIAQLSRSAGIHVMASAGSEQFATEFAELGHGLFTYILIQALQGAADGAPKDGKVTIYELKSFMDDQVPELSRKLKGKPQYPYTFSRGQDFPLILQQE
jgi:WD40 repeat protein